MKRITAWIVGTLVVATLLVAGPARGAEKIKITVPAHSTTFAPLYHASAAGYFAEEGLDVEVVVIAGTASLQAVIARDAQFALAPGTYQLMAHERGQRLLAVMSILTRNSINVVMHKDVARDKGITDTSPLSYKIRALKGLKLSGSAPGGFSHQVLVYCDTGHYKGYPEGSRMNLRTAGPTCHRAGATLSWAPIGHRL